MKGPLKVAPFLLGEVFSLAVVARLRYDNIFAI
jgi:hypothetical protein